MYNLDRENEKVCKKNKLTGANLVLFDSNQIIYSYNYGYANKGERIESTNESLYMIGSNTKVFTGICIMKLVEDGVISLDDNIKKYIPEFEVKSTFKYEKITVANLLMHRSGLVSDLFDLIVDKGGDFHNVIKEIKNTYLTSMPGTMFAYSNVGYTLLGIIIERASGLTYKEYVEKTIAKPLGIGIYFLQTKEERKTFSPKISLCYNRKGKEVEDPLCTMLPAGTNTYMSITDFVKFGQIFLKKDGTVLKKETLELMETLDCPENIDNELCNGGYGLIHNMYNFGENVGKILGHGGDTMYHHSIFYYISEHNIGVAVFTNNEQAPNAADIMADKAVLTYLKKKGIIVEKNTYIYNYGSQQGDKYIGKYATLLGVCDIKKNKRGEFITKIKGLSVKLRPCSDGYWQLLPNNLLMQLPPIKKQIKKLRVKMANYAGEEVLLLEQRDDNNKSEGICGCRYEKTIINKSFMNACGHYTLANEKLKDMKGSCQLSIKNDILYLKVKLLGMKTGIACLKVVDDNLAFVQGFGRNTRNDVRIREEAGVQYLSWCGLIFKKVKK